MAWACGAEWVLQRVIRDAYHTGVPGLDRWTLHGENPRTWDDLLTTSPRPRAVTVAGAQELKSLDLLPHLLGDEFDGSFVLFLSTEDDFRRDGRQLIAPLAALRDSRHGQVIRCCAPASEEDQAAIVAGWWPGAGRNIGAELLQHCGGSLSQAWHATEKARQAGLAPDARLVAHVCVSRADSEYADSLLRGDRAAAMRAARAVPDSVGGAIIGLLAARLTLLPLVRAAVLRREPPGDTARRLRTDPWVLRQLRPHAGDYPPERVDRCRELVAIGETAWRSGARDGVLEAIAALW